MGKIPIPGSQLFPTPGNFPFPGESFPGNGKGLISRLLSDFPDDETPRETVPAWETKTLLERQEA